MHCIPTKYKTYFITIDALSVNHDFACEAAMAMIVVFPAPEDACTTYEYLLAPCT